MSLEDLTIEQLRELASKAQAMEPSFNLVQQLSKDPEARNMFQRYLKKKNPNLSIPEIDSEDRMKALVEDEKKAREKLEAKYTEDAIRERVEKERARVMDRYKLTAEDMAGVEKLMVKSEDNPEPIPYYDAAAKLFLAARTPSTPTPSIFSPPTYTMPEGKVWGKGIGNSAELNRIAMNEAYRAYADIKGGKVAQ
jgi:hypothetical protein